MATAIPFKEYGISNETGFTPDLPDSLPDYYRPWHELATKTTSLVISQKMREETLKLPLLETSKLTTSKDLQLALLQLCTISGGYCWERGPMGLPQFVPACVAIPLCDISDKLGMQPGMSYYCLLGNWQRIDKTRPITRDNIQVRYPLPGGQQFIDFTTISVQIESSFTKTFPALENLFQGSELNDASRVIEGLKFLTQWVKDLELVSKEFHQIMQPDTFFHEIISLFHGSALLVMRRKMPSEDIKTTAMICKERLLPEAKYFMTESRLLAYLTLDQKSPRWLRVEVNLFLQRDAEVDRFNETCGLPEGMTYEGVTERPKRKVINSAASQSVMLQIIDLLLRVDYPVDKQNYFSQLRVSWPSRYRQFFHILESSPRNVREMARSGDSQELTEAYNELLAALHHFRTYHVQLVTKFMLIPNKRLRQKLNVTDPDPFAHLMTALKDIRNAAAESKVE